MNKSIISTLVLLVISVSVGAQTYNTQLEQAAKQIAEKIKSVEKDKVAVLDFSNSDGRVCELGSWFASVFTTHLENASIGDFVVKNKADVEKALEQIKAESGSGAYDSRTIQRLGEISGSDVIVYGNITLMDNEVTVNIKTKDISLSKSIGGILKSFTATEGMRSKYDNCESNGNKVESGNFRSNGPSGESSSSKSKDPNCQRNNTGDYCFKNSTKDKVVVTLRNWKITLQPAQSQCYFSKLSGSYTYNIKPINEQNRYGPEIAVGNAFVETCKTKTFVIK